MGWHGLREDMRSMRVMEANVTIDLARSVPDRHGRRRGREKARQDCVEGEGDGDGMAEGQLRRAKRESQWGLVGRYIWGVGERSGQMRRRSEIEAWAALVRYAEMGSHNDLVVLSTEAHLVAVTQHSRVSHALE